MGMLGAKKGTGVVSRKDACPPRPLFRSSPFPISWLAKDRAGVQTKGLTQGVTPAKPTEISGDQAHEQYPCYQQPKPHQPQCPDQPRELTRLPNTRDATPETDAG
jgi:hypothetical protein